MQHDRPDIAIDGDPLSMADAVGANAGPLDRGGYLQQTIDSLANNIVFSLLAAITAVARVLMYSSLLVSEHFLEG